MTIISGNGNYSPIGIGASGLSASAGLATGGTHDGAAWSWDHLPGGPCSYA